MKRILLRIILAFTGLMVLAILLATSTNLFSVYHPVTTNNYLIEAWIRPADLEQSIPLLKGQDDPRIFVVGQTYETVPYEAIREDDFYMREEGVVMLTNSCLIIRPEQLEPFSDADTAEIIVRMQGGRADGIFAHLNLVVNGRACQSFFSSERARDYRARVFVPHGIRTLSLYYDNDYAKRSEGRYLIVQSLSVNGHHMVLDSTNSLFTFSAPGNFTGFYSAADWARYYLSQLGLDTNSIRVVAFEKNRMNQTLAGARKFAEWSKSRKPGSFNIITEKLHSRRSWMTYLKVMGPDTKVGVLYFQGDQSEARPPDHWWDPGYRRLDEMFSLVGNWFYLNFIHEAE